jgi:hypothetical protein
MMRGFHQGRQRFAERLSATKRIGKPVRAQGLKSSCAGSGAARSPLTRIEDWRVLFMEDGRDKYLGGMFGRIA